MVTKIKRIAQFVWDNADAIAEYLEQSENYRAVSFSFQLNAFGPKKPSDCDIEFNIYDESHTHLYLHNNDITTEEFAKACEKMNRETGVTPPPEPVKVREKLETK